jgi:hypothetical protein
MVGFVMLGLGFVPNGEFAGGEEVLLLGLRAD